MNFEMKKEKLCTKDCAEKIRAEQSIETDISLPDYCAEIKKILRCTVTPGIHSVSRTGDRVSARGTVLIRVIYLGESDKTDCYEKNLDLAVSGQMKNITDDMVLSAKAAVNYVNCRAVNQRKITVGSAVSVQFTAMQISKKEYPCEIDNGCIQTKITAVKSENLLCMGEKTFDMGETVVLPKSMPSAEKILRQNSYIVLESKKAVSGKLLIKGECVTEIVYLPQESKNRTQFFRHTMPLSQIIDIDGIDETMDCNVKCRPSQLIAGIKNNSDESGRLIEFALRITAEFAFTKTEEHSFITDCYSTEGEIETEYSLTDIKCPVSITEKTEKVNENIELGTNAKEICDVWVSEIRTDMKGEGDKAKGNCILGVSILYLDENDTPVYTEKELEFYSEVPLKENCESTECMFDATVRKAECSTLQKGKTQLTLEVAVAVKIYSITSCRVLTDVKMSEGKNNASEKPALTLYFCDKDEKVWDIAKKYGTTCQAINEENGIDGELIREERMLLIPCV